MENASMTPGFVISRCPWNPLFLMMMFHFVTTRNWLSRRLHPEDEQRTVDNIYDVQRYLFRVRSVVICVKIMFDVRSWFHKTKIDVGIFHELMMMKLHLRTWISKFAAYRNVNVEDLLVGQTGMYSCCEGIEKDS